LTATTAGHVAEVITGRRWEDLIRERVLGPLGMNGTGFTLPDTGNVTLSYHENSHRELVLTRRLLADVTAPSGGSIHSTIEDMARWLAFNLSDGEVAGHRLLAASTLKELHSPCVVAGADPGSPSANAAYGLGWFVDTYQGHARISHGGYLNDVQSSVMLFPDDDLGVVAFTNFGGPRLASLMNQHIFDHLMGLTPTQTVEERISAYEKKIEETRVRNAAARRVENTSPSHSLEDYAGRYEHAGYGPFVIRRQNQTLSLERNHLVLPLEHWHYDTWIANDDDMFGIDSSHEFDRTGRLMFEMNADGEIASLSIRLEPAVAPIRFDKQ